MADFNSIDTSDLKKKKEELEKKINNLQEIGISNPAQSIVEKVKGKLLTKRQIAKKFLIIQGQKFNPPFYEEDAQLFIYGKVYYKNGKLYDNDVKDPSCVAKPSDEDYQPPINSDHPLWKKIEKMIKDLLDSLKQFGIKIGEFLVAIPAAIITIATSLIALVSSIVILPFGAGIPPALTAVQTLVATIKELQAKISAFLPFLDPIVDAIGIVLDKLAQAIEALIIIIIVMVDKIIGLITGIVGLIGKVISAMGKAKDKMDNQSFSVEAKANPDAINIGQSTTLSATATGGDWNFSYEWADPIGTVISKTSEVTLIPYVQSNIKTVTYNCKVMDGTGTIKQSSATIKIL